MPIPSRLRPVTVSVQKKHSKSQPVADFLLGNIDWSDPALKPIKAEYRALLRIHQDGKCVFCRRAILPERRNAYEDIEHYLDKSKAAYRRWAFHPLNLSLSCRACNIEKGIKDLGCLLAKGAKRHPNRNFNYKWLHPYFDDYNTNIIIESGPVYIPVKGAPKYAQAKQMIADLKLDQIKELQKRKYEAMAKLTKLNELAAKCVEKKKLASALKVLARQNTLLKDYEL